MNDISFASKEELISFTNIAFGDEYNFVRLFLDNKETIELQTSGSTGTPKIIEVRKEFMINSAKATGEYFNLKAQTTALLCMNPNYVGGKMMLVRAMVLGWHLDVVIPSSTPLKDAPREYDFCAMVPMQVYHSLNELHKINKLIIGGGAVSSSLKKSLQDVSVQCFGTYGMTETVSHVAVIKLNNFLADNKWSRSVYNVLPNISITADKRNCLVINAPKISETEIVTNDVVEIISDSAFNWLGRYDNVINSGGVKLYPEQIEEKLSEMIERRFFVIGISDKILGQKLILLIERSGEVDVILNGLKNLGTLSKFEIPKEVYIIPSFIETETKKIQRKKTLDLLKFR